MALLVGFFTISSISRGIGSIPDSLTVSPDIDFLSFQPVSLQEGDPAGHVAAVIQTPDGFIWYGTKEGAHRFDGYRVKTYSHVKNDPASLINSIVLAFHVDQFNNLWIGTFKGVSRYIPESESFANYLLDEVDTNSNLTNHCNAFARDSRNNLYVTSEAGFVFRYHPESDRFVRINTASFGIIKSMVVDSRDRLWIGSNNAVFVFDPRTLNTRQFRKPFEPESSGVINFIEGIHYENENTVLVGTAINGVVILDPADGSTKTLPVISSGEQYVHHIHKDSSGNIWLGHDGGISILNPSLQRIKLINTTSQPGPLPSSGIHTLLIDAQGNVWAGTAQHGLYMATHNKQFSPLHYYLTASEGDLHPNISSMMQDSKGRLWVGRHTEGIDVFDSGHNLIKRFRPEPSDPASLAPYSVFALHEDPLGEIWVGAYRGGLQRYKPQSNSFETFLYDPADPASIPGNDIRKIVSDANGNLWVLTHGKGLAYYDRESGHFTHYKHDPLNSSRSLQDDWGSELHFSSHHHLLFVGSEVGLSVYKPDHDSFTNYQASPSKPSGLQNSVINAIYEDSANRIWLATNDGIAHFNPKNGTCKTYSLEQGLPNRVIVSIVEDDDGMLWLGTSGGLVRFAPESGAIKAYDALDGLLGNEFTPRTALKSHAGRLYFGQKKGVLSFTPSDIRDNTYLPKIHITDFKVYNKSLIVNPDDPAALPRSILETREITLLHDQKMITIEYVALGYVQSKKNRYAYRLTGFDLDWIDAACRREATYTNLNPGTYTFEVKASNNDGYWSDEPRSLKITVPSPYWATWWFRTLFVLTIIMVPALLAMWRFRIIRRQKLILEKTVDERTSDLQTAFARLSDTNHELENAYRNLSTSQLQIEAQNRELVFHRENLEAMVCERTAQLEQAKEKAEMSDKLKSTFLANMSHEIRTPLNAIIGLLQVIANEDYIPPDERHRYMEIIFQSSNTLLSLINDILDLSRIEAGEATLNPCSVDVATLCLDLVRQSAQTEAHECTPVAMHLVLNGLAHPPASPITTPVWMVADQVRIRQILANLISNAVKFTAEGTITLRCDTIPPGPKSPEGTIRFEIEDTGIGIPHDELEKIFERFHKVEHADRIYPGSGLGLSIARRLVVMMGGTINVRSELGKGTCFTVTLPVSHQRVPATPPPPSHSRSATSYTLESPEATDDPEGHLADLGGMLFLVAEDEEPNFEFIKLALRITGAKVHHATDGRMALDFYRQNTYDLILLDIKMPKLSGFEVLREIRKSDALTPVIAQTAFAMKEDEVECYAAGANRFLPKPYTPRQLIREIEDLLASS